MTLQIVRFTAFEDKVPEVEDGIKGLFKAVEAAQPQGTRYLATRFTGTPEFLLMLHLVERVPNPLPAIPEAATFQRHMMEWALDSPAPQPVTVLGDHRMLD